MNFTFILNLNVLQSHNNCCVCDWWHRRPMKRRSG
jgi:hypothetical protein